MATRPANPILQFPSPPRTFIRRNRPILPAGLPPVFEEPFGVFRGLAFALLFQFLIGLVGYAGWEMIRHLL